MATQPEPIEEPEIIPDDTGADDAGELTEVEVLATEMGWKPKAQYGGDETKWKPAKEYVLAERDISRGLKDTVKGLKDTMDRLVSTQDKQLSRALKEQAEAIEAKFTQAVEDGDTAGAARAAKEMQELEKAQPAASVEDQFARDNPWYGQNGDPDATAYAAMVSQRELAKGIPFERHKTTVEAAVKKAFPELFGDTKTAAKAPPAVNNPNSRAQVRNKGTGFSDLPAEVKAAAEKHAAMCQQQFGKDPEKAKADYAKTYFANVSA